MASRLGPALLDRLIAWSPVLLLGSLAALTYWLDAQIQPTPARDGSARHDPDIVVDNFRAVNLDESGRPLQMLQARQARHYPDDNTTEFSEPQLTLTYPDRPRFSVVAERGRLSGDRENAWFEGHVRAVREADPPGREGGSGAIVVTSERLHVVPKEDKVTTDRPVTIEEARGIIRASGFVLDDRAKTIKLSGPLTGTMQPRALDK